MSSKEDYLDSLLESVNASGKSAGKAAAQNAAEVQMDKKSSAAADSGKREISLDDDSDSEELEFPELAALFAEDEESEEADKEEANIEEYLPEAEEASVSESASEAQEAVNESASEVQEAVNESASEVQETVSEQVSEAQRAAKMPDSESEEASGEEPMTEAAFGAAVSDMEAFPLRDAEDMDIAELEAMLSGISSDMTGVMPAAAERAPMSDSLRGASSSVSDSAGQAQDSAGQAQDSAGQIQDVSEQALYAVAQEADAEKQMGMDAEQSKIDELLSDSGDPDAVSDDMAEIEAMLGGSLEEAGLGQEDAADLAGLLGEEAETADETKLGRKEKREKKKKEKKEKKQKDAAEKKPGILSRFLKFLTEDDEISDLEAELGQIDLSEENIAILESMDQEAGKGGQKKSLFKKKEKEKKPKEKKPKEKKVKEKKPKEKKPPKEKKVKEKKPKEVVPEVPLKPIGKRKIVTGALFGATVFGMIVMCTSYIPDAMDKQESKTAFEEGDFEKVYQLLVTKKLSNGKEKLLKGATLCLQIDRKLESYENYKKLGGMELEQLDTLISGVGKYQKIQNEAVQYGVAEPMKNSYLSILGILQSEYGVSEEQAKALALESDSVAYTKGLMQILGMEIPKAEEEDKR